DALVRARLAVLPGRVIAQLLQALAQPDLRPGPAVRHRIALRGGVLEPQLNRVDPELAGQIVHRRLDREHGLRAAGGTVGAGWRGVGDDGVAANLEAREAVEGAG